MNVFFWIGETLFLCLIGMAIKFGGSIGDFFDSPSIVIVVGCGFAMSLMSFTWAEIKKAFSHAFGGDGTVEELELSAYFWECSIRNIFIVGILGTTIGMVQMLASLSDPEMIGCAVAVGLLTVLYSFIVNAMLPIPAYYQIKKRLSASK